MDGPQSETVHGTCVALAGRGLLITGASGSGKSGLALQLMAFGAELVADDRCILTLRAGRLIASCPAPILGRIEARGLGILAAAPLAEAALVAEVDLDRAETERLPPGRLTHRLGVGLPLILNAPGLPFAAALLQYLRSERVN